MRRHEVKIKIERSGLIAFVKYVKSWVTVNGQEYVREQIPLIPAFAVTVHRAQGMSLRYLRLQLEGQHVTNRSYKGEKEGFWEHGQAYVALSRVEESEGLHLTAFDISAFVYDEELLAWQRNLKYE